MRVAYLRTSTEEQNPENQLSDVKVLASDGALEVLVEQQSAWKDVNRPVFESIIKRIKAGSVSDLYVWDLDRLYRNRLKVAAFLNLCKAYKCKVHSFRQSWLEEINRIPAPWNDIVNDLLVNVFGWIAEEESVKKSERVKAAIRKKDDGTFSYKGNRWGRKPLSKKTISKVLELHKEGLSVRKIASKVIVWDSSRNSRNISVGAVHKIISGGVV